MVKACLIIVFNHRYDKNIPILEKIYGQRFSRLFFLVPFYDGDHPNVIPVYESSHYFQSFFAQGYSRFHQADCSHYLFVGDDCILNPAINESNFLEQTGLPAGTDFIPEINQFSAEKGEPWWHTFKGIEFFTNRKGAEIARELPSREEAVERFRRHGVDTRPLSSQNIFGSKTPKPKGWFEYWLFKKYHFNYRWRKYKRNGKIELPYPIVGSYSDIIIVTENSIREFCRYCGIMSAAGLFVEIAIPTALLLVSQKLVQEKDLRLKGLALWTREEIENVETVNERSLRAFFKNFPDTQLYYHPVKLSKWTNDL